MVRCHDVVMRVRSTVCYLFLVSLSYEDVVDLVSVWVSSLLSVLCDVFSESAFP